MACIGCRPYKPVVETVSRLAVNFLRVRYPAIVLDALRSA